MMKRFIPLLTLGILLFALATAICTAAPESGRRSVDPQSVHKELQDILSRPEYNRTFTPPWYEKIFQRIGEAFKDFVEWLFRMPKLALRGSSDIASITFATLVVAAFGFIVFLVIRWLRWRAQGDPGEDGAFPEDYELPSARPLIKQAAKLAETGDYRGAFRCAYLASISHLDEIKALRFERSRTNWEYLRDLKQGGFEGPYGELQPLTLDFDRKFYGREKCENGDYEKAVSTYESISREGAK